MHMKFSIGTASSSMIFEEDLRLIKSSLLYADKIELIGMAEYAIYNYLPRCLMQSKDIDSVFANMIPLLKSFDNSEAQILADQLLGIKEMIEPYMPYLKKKRRRNKQEILAQIQIKKVESQCTEMFEKALSDLMNKPEIREIKSLIDRQLVNVYDYSYTNFSLDELTGGYFANLLGTIKSGVAYPLFDRISSDIVKATIKTEILDFSSIDKEVIRHAGIANSILQTLPTLENASVDEILDFKKELKVPLENFRISIYGFSEKVISMPWDKDFQYECMKLYNTEVIPKVNEINELSSETSVLKNFGRKVIADEEERRKLGYLGAGLATTITTNGNIFTAIEWIEKMIRNGVKVGLTAATISAFLKTADLLREARKECKEAKQKQEGNVMYYYYKAYKGI